MIFILSYFRPTLFHPAHCMELRNRVEIEFLRNSSRVPFSIHLPPLLSPPSPPSFLKIDARGASRTAKSPRPCPDFPVSPWCTYTRKFGRSISGNEQDFAQKHETASAEAMKNKSNLTSDLSASFVILARRLDRTFCSDDRTIFGA